MKAIVILRNGKRFEVSDYQASIHGLEWVEFAFPQPPLNPMNPRLEPNMNDGCAHVTCYRYADENGVPIFRER
jgi:hypothetical protein